MIKIEVILVFVLFLFVAVFDNLLISGTVKDNVQNTMLINEVYNALTAFFICVLSRVYKTSLVVFFSGLALFGLATWNILSMTVFIEDQLYYKNVSQIIIYASSLILIVSILKPILNKKDG